MKLIHKESSATELWLKSSEVWLLPLSRASKQAFWGRPAHVSPCKYGLSLFPVLRSSSWLICSCVEQLLGARGQCARKGSTRCPQQGTYRRRWGATSCYKQRPCSTGWQLPLTEGYPKDIVATLSRETHWENQRRLTRREAIELFNIFLLLIFQNARTYY